MAACTFDGVVCTSRDQQHYGFVVFRVPADRVVSFECARWCYPVTDDGRAQARQDMVRLIDRLTLEQAHASARALGALASV